MKKGIDVSVHNGTIQWEQVKNSGIDFVMIRAGYGQNNIDRQFKRNIEECNRLNIPVGIYWFSYAQTPESALKEAEFCIEAIKNYKISYPVCYDFEYASSKYLKQKGINVTAELLRQNATTFLKRIEKEGYYAMLYTNKDYYINVFKPLSNQFDIWYAQYGVSKPEISCGIWQKNSVGKINGIYTNVDLNISYKDYETITKPKVTEEDNTKNTVLKYIDAAFKVLNGHYGNGEQRKKKLSSDGFDYSLIQSIVNIIKTYE